MSTEGPKLGDTVEVTGLPTRTIVKVTTERHDAIGLTFEVSGQALGSYRPSFTPDKFEPTDVDDAREDTREQTAKWRVDYGDTCGIEGT